MASKNFLTGTDRLKLGSWASANWPRLQAAKATSTAAAAEAKAALGVTITANNVLGVAEALGLAPLLDDRGNGTVRLTPEFAAQVKAAGELTVETLGTLQTTMQALVEGMARLEKQMAELQQR